MNKTCFKCKCSKDASEFYGHPKMADRLLGKCKECTRTDVRINYQRNREAYAEYERRRFNDPARKAKVAEYQRARRQKFPEKRIARQSVGNAIRDGRLVRPPCCQLCGERGRVQAHHADYSKPLEVEWLCFKCHREHRHGQRTIAA